MTRSVPEPPPSNLADLRIGFGVTQLELAIRLRMPQSGVSRIEHQDDALLSTLARYIDGLDGQLLLSARFGDDTVRIHIPSIVRPRHLGIAARRRGSSRRVTSADPLEASGVVEPPAPGARGFDGRGGC